MADTVSMISMNDPNGDFVLLGFSLRAFLEELAKAYSVDGIYDFMSLLDVADPASAALLNSTLEGSPNDYLNELVSPFLNAIANSPQQLLLNGGKGQRGGGPPQAVICFVFLLFMLACAQGLIPSPAYTKLQVKFGDSDSWPTDPGKPPSEPPKRGRWFDFLGLFEKRANPAELARHREALAKYSADLKRFNEFDALLDIWRNEQEQQTALKQAEVDVEVQSAMVRKLSAQADLSRARHNIDLTEEAAAQRYVLIDTLKENKELSSSLAFMRGIIIGGTGVFFGFAGLFVLQVYHARRPPVRGYLAPRDAPPNPRPNNQPNAQPNNQPNNQPNTRPGIGMGGRKTKANRKKRATKKTKAARRAHKH